MLRLGILLIARPEVRGCNHHHRKIVVVLPACRPGRCRARPLWARLARRRSRCLAGNVTVPSWRELSVGRFEPSVVEV